MKKHIRFSRFAIVCVVAAIAAVGATSGSARVTSAPVGPTPPVVGSFTDTLSPVPHPAYSSGVTAKANLHLVGQQLTAILTAQGLSPNLAHAIHIHGKDSPEVAMCPNASRADDIRADGLIETAEGLPDYGPVRVSFTETGDTSPASTFALDRFSVANSSGVLKYQRTFTIPADVASRLGDMELVIHGADDALGEGHDGSYASYLSALNVPIEAELPVACGEINTR